MQMINGDANTHRQGKDSRTCAALLGIGSLRKWLRPVSRTFEPTAKEKATTKQTLAYHWTMPSVTRRARMRTRRWMRRMEYDQKGWTKSRRSLVQAFSFTFRLESTCQICFHGSKCNQISTNFSPYSILTTHSMHLFKVVKQSYICMKKGNVLVHIKYEINMSGEKL